MYTSFNRSKWTPYLWLLPSIALIAIFVIYPIILVFKLSFSEISKSGVVGKFNGFQNYIDAVNLPAFKTVMLNICKSVSIWIIPGINGLPGK